MPSLKAHEAKQLGSLEPITVLNDLQLELNGLEQHHPVLSADAGYIALRQELDFAETDRSNITFELLEAIYGRISVFLKTVQLQDNVIAFGAPRRINKPPIASFLPATFEDFLETISREKQKEAFYEDAIEAAAHSLILGEISHGLDEIVPNFREAVRNRTMDELADLKAGAALVELEEVDLFKMLKLSEDELVDEHMDGDDFAVALSILTVREELNATYKVTNDSSKAGKPRDPNFVKTTKAATEELKMADIGLYNLLKTAVLSKTESPQESRRKLASRIMRVVRAVD